MISNKATQQRSTRAHSPGHQKLAKRVVSPPMNRGKGSQGQGSPGGRLQKGTLARPSANPTSPTPPPRSPRPPRLEQPPWRPAGYLEPPLEAPLVDAMGSVLDSRCSSPRLTPPRSREVTPVS